MTAKVQQTFASFICLIICMTFASASTFAQSASRPITASSLMAQINRADLTDEEARQALVDQFATLSTAQKAQLLMSLRQRLEKIYGDITHSMQDLPPPGFKGKEPRFPVTRSVMIEAATVLGLSSLGGPLLLNFGKSMLDQLNTNFAEALAMTFKTTKGSIIQLVKSKMFWLAFIPGSYTLAVLNERRRENRDWQQRLNTEHVQITSEEAILLLNTIEARSEQLKLLTRMYLALSEAEAK